MFKVNYSPGGGEKVPLIFEICLISLEKFFRGGL